MTTDRYSEGQPTPMRITRRARTALTLTLISGAALARTLPIWLPWSW